MLGFSPQGQCPTCFFLLVYCCVQHFAANIIVDVKKITNFASKYFFKNICTKQVL